MPSARYRGVRAWRAWRGLYTGTNAFGRGGSSDAGNLRNLVLFRRKSLIWTDRLWNYFTKARIRRKSIY
jgi:hypothetical protein